MSTAAAVAATTETRVAATGKKDLALKILGALGGLAFMAFGAGKVMAGEEYVANFAAWGLPKWLLIQVGIFEILGGLLYLLPRTASLGGIIGTAIMTVAIGAHAAHGEFAHLVMPVLFLALFLAVGWMRRAELFRLIGPRA